MRTSIGKFRGISTETNEWIYGYFFTFMGVCFIKGSDGFDHVVYTDSVGEFTGRLDDDGVEMYEGDLIEWVYHITHGPHEEGISPIIYDEEFMGFFIEDLTPIELSKCKVVGAIHD